jgi:hypothetical protein
MVHSLHRDSVLQLIFKLDRLSFFLVLTKIESKFEEILGGCNRWALDLRARAGIRASLEVFHSVEFKVGLRGIQIRFSWFQELVEDKGVCVRKQVDSKAKKSFECHRQKLETMSG